MLTRQPLSNLRLSLLGADVSTGLANYYNAGAGARTSIGDIFKGANVGRPTSIPGHAGTGFSRLRAYETGANLSFSSILGSSQTFANGNPQSPSGWDSGDFVYIKTLPVDGGQWRSLVPGAPFYTSSPSASGAMIAGTNGDLNGAFIGYGPNYESYYMWGGNSKHYRLGVNVYRLSADGAEFQRVYTHHHIADIIGDQSCVSLGLGNMSPSNGLKHGGAIIRNQGNGKPTVMIGGYNPVNNTWNNNNWMSGNTIENVNEWGQPLDAIDLGMQDDGLRSGLFLWQRQWWGPRLVVFSHNGSSIIHQQAKSLDVFYQGWIFDHNFGGQGGVAYSPVSKRACAIFSYEPNGTTYGRNLAINHVQVDNMGTYPSIGETVRTDTIHFIWGTDELCRPDWGQYSACAIDYMTNLSEWGDFFAIAYVSPSQDRVYVRLLFVDFDGTWGTGDVRRGPCNWTDVGETYGLSYESPHHTQRVRVTRLNVVPNSAGTVTIHFAVSYVNNSNQTVVKIFRGGPSIGLEEIASYIPNARGLLARNGSPGEDALNGNRAQHAVVVGTTNDGYQSTYVWDGNKGGSMGRSGDQDLTRVIKLV